MVPRDANVKGFTLIELAVVIALVGLMMGAVIPSSLALYQVGQMKETQISMKGIESALLGFVIVNHRLPCADTTSDGLEDCPDTSGALPWQSLGVKPDDAWRQPFSYAVTEEFTYATQPGQPPGPNQLDLTDTGDITVGGSSIASAVVLSAGITGVTSDDIVIWLSPFVVLGRLQEVAALP